MKRVSNPGYQGDSALKANPFPEADWWAAPMRTAILHKLDGLKKARPVRLVSGCSGFGTDSLALEVLGFDFIVTSCSDAKTCAQIVLRQQHRHIEHAYGSMRDQCLRHNCLWHGSACRAVPKVTDLYVGGPPCQPYSDARPGRYTHNRPEGHPLYSVLFATGPNADSFLSSVESLQPLGFIMEEVNGFSKKCDDEQHSQLDKFLGLVKGIRRTGSTEPLITGVSVLRLDGPPWLEVNRDRCTHLLEGRWVSSINPV